MNEIKQMSLCTVKDGNAGHNKKGREGGFARSYSELNFWFDLKKIMISFVFVWTKSKH